MHHHRSTRRPLFAQSLLTDFDQLANLLQGRVPDFPVNMRDTGTALEFHAFLPGVGKDDGRVNARVDEQTLIIEVKALPVAPETDPETPWLLEEHRRADGGERRFRLPDGLDTSQIKASLRNGVLVVSIPRATSRTAQSIVIDE